MGLVPLEEERWERSLFLPCEDTGTSCLSVNQEEGTNLKPDCTDTFVLNPQPPEL